MGALMCVDIDLNSDGEDDDGVSSDRPVGVVEILESEVREAKEKGDGTLRWLELEGLDIDDDMLLSHELPTRFPVCDSIFTSFFLYFEF